MKKMRVAVVQVSAGRNTQDNMERIRTLVGPVAHVDLIAFPEVVAFRGSDEDYVSKAESLDGPIVTFFSELARKAHAWVLIGSLPERDRAGVYNTSILMDRNGKIVQSYRKIHLFEAYLEDGRHIRERNAFLPGEHLAQAQVDGWNVGLSICYDLRFPELYRRMAAKGCHLLFAPANFTQRTGVDHWEVLLRARAIENQCFVVAPAQCGINPSTGIASYGNSMVVGPWGEILGRAGDDEFVLTCDLDPDTLHAIRKRLPVLEHMRKNIE